MSQKDMLGEALQEISGPLKTFFERLSGEEGWEWLEAFKRFLCKENPWETVTKAVKKSKLLKFISTVIVPVTTERFVAKNAFRVDTGDEAPVKISYVGDNFQEWFGDKIEEPITEQTLRYFKLQKDSVDGPIIAELGGEKKAETALTEMIALMAKQANGEKGVLLTDGKANIFYIRDTKGLLRAVSVRWDGYGWNVNAYSVEDPDRWYGGFQVFSRNSESL